MMDETLGRLQACRVLLMRVVRLRSMLRGEMFHSAGRIHNGFSSSKRNTTPQTFFHNLTVLRRCLYREKELMRVVEHSFPAAMADLKVLIKDSNMQQIRIEEKQANARLLRGYRLLWNSMDHIYKRMKLQEEFIEKQDFETFYRFMRLLNKRPTLDSTIIELLVQKSYWHTLKSRIGLMKEKQFIGMLINLATWFIVFFSLGNFIPLSAPWKTILQICLSLLVFGITTHNYIRVANHERIDYNNRKQFDKMLRYQ